MITELEIPDGAYRAAMIQITDASLRAISAPVVAAELDRLAAEAMRISDEEMEASNDRDDRTLLMGRSLGSAGIANVLRARAAELRGAK